jgi:hypothetical protein
MVPDLTPEPGDLPRHLAELLPQALGERASRARGQCPQVPLEPLQVKLHAQKGFV